MASEWCSSRRWPRAPASSSTAISTAISTASPTAFTYSTVPRHLSNRYVTGERSDAAVEASRAAYRESLLHEAAPILSADRRLLGSRDRLLDIFESADIDLSGELEPAEFGLALRLVVRAWPLKAGAAAVGGSGLGSSTEAGDGAVGVTPEEAMRFAQMDSDGGGTVSFSELVRFHQRQLDLAERMQRGFKLKT